MTTSRPTIAALDLIMRFDLDQRAPVITATNFTMSFITETVHERILHGIPFAKLIEKRRPIAVTRVLPYTIIIWPPLSIDDLAKVQGLTDECLVELERIPKKMCGCVLF